MALAVWCGPVWGETVPAAQSPSPVARGHEPVRPLTAPAGLDPRKVALGRALFFDPMLSRDQSVSCATCHDFAKGGGDGLPVSLGVAGARGGANAPTVFNTALNVAQFWDGRAATLEEQVDGPLVNPVEMAADWPMVLERLRRSSHGAAFLRIYGGPPDAASVRDAIASFEKSLVTLDSPFDRWLAGDDSALSADQKRGYALFKSYGCASCHQGAAVGGNMFQKFGFFGDWFADRGRSTPEDLGRFNVTKRAADRHVFKVPSLRLATLTAPYFHDGSVPDLKEAIRLMGRYQLGRDIDGRDVDLMVSFLGSLVDPARLKPAP